MWHLDVSGHLKPDYLLVLASFATCTWKVSHILLNTLQKKIDDECSIVHERDRLLLLQPDHREAMESYSMTALKQYLNLLLFPSLPFSYFSLSLPLNLLHLSLYCLLCSKISLEFKNRELLCAVWVSHDTWGHAPTGLQSFFPAPPFLDPLTLGLGLC